MARTKEQTKAYNGFAIPLEPDTELDLAMLIAEDEEGTTSRSQSPARSTRRRRSPRATSAAGCAASSAEATLGCAHMPTSSGPAGSTATTASPLSWTPTRCSRPSPGPTSRRRI